MTKRIDRRDFVASTLATAAAATVGTMTVAPGAANVIPAEATFSLDLRHPHDAVRRNALRQLRATATRIARRRRLTFTWTTTQDNAAVTCSPEATTTSYSSS